MGNLKSELLENLETQFSTFSESEVQEVFKILTFLLTNMSTILTTVKTVEDIVGAGNGATKKELIMNVVQAAVQGGEKVNQTQIQAVSAFIDSTVTTLNKSGILNPPTPIKP